MKTAPVSQGPLLQQSLGDLKITGLTRNWGDFALKELSLEAKAGEYLVVLGPSGSGKTLLLETLAGLHQPERGKIELGGEDITNLAPEKRKVGFVYQKYYLFPHLSVRDNLAFGLRYQRLSRAEKHQRIQRAAREVGIEYLLNRPTVANLSGGEMQKVALARALCVEPRLILLDEPLSSMDYHSRENVFPLLLGLKARFQVPILHVTHDHNEALQLADRIAVMFNGRLVQIGPAREVFWQPKTRQVARFLGIPNLAEAEIEVGPEGARAVMDGRRLRLPKEIHVSGGKHWLCFRPEAIEPRPEKAAGENVLSARLVELSASGFLMRATLQLGKDTFAARVPAGQVQAAGWQVGAEVKFALPPESLHVVED